MQNKPQKHTTETDYTKVLQAENRRGKNELFIKSHTVEDYKTRGINLEKTLNQLKSKQQSSSTNHFPAHTNSYPNPNHYNDFDNFTNEFFSKPDMIFSDNFFNSPFMNMPQMHSSNHINHYHNNHHNSNPHIHSPQFSNPYSNICDPLEEMLGYQTNNHPVNDLEDAEADIIAQLEPNPDNMTYEQLLEGGDNVGTVSKGLTKDQMKKIPVISYNKRMYPDCDKCAICQYDFKNMEKANSGPCKHLFHVDCVKEWFQTNKVCPCCKKEVV